ncbi:MAG: FG-GAP-like repeat-containing protein [bacterium]|jgi:hypothetical protein
MRSTAVAVALCLLATDLISASTAHGGFTGSAPFGANGTISLAWGDYDLDGDLDLAVGNYTGSNRLFTNDGGGAFTEQTPFGDRNTFVVLWVDFDNDGDADMSVGNTGTADNQNLLYLNNGDSTFTEGPLLGKKRTNAMAWADYDLDGDLDLAVGNGLLNNPQANRLLINNGDSTFTSVARFGGNQSASIIWGDFDNDGDPDLAVGNGGFGYIEQNYLYINEGDTVFTEIPEFGLGDTSCLVAGDFDNDGDLDVAVANWDGGQNYLYINNGDATFVPVPRFGLRDPNTFAWGDADNDGDLDLAVGNGDFGSADTNFLYVNNGDTTFTETPEFGLGSTDGVAWGDCDNDGDLDLAAGNEHSPPTNYLYTNDTDGDDYLIVRLVGHYHDIGIPYSNRDGIGAKITLYETGHLGEADYIIGYREVCAHGGFASQNSIDAHFGVAGAATVDMRIVWPGSGGANVTQDAEGVATGRRLVIHETQMASIGQRESPLRIRLSEARPNPSAGGSALWFSISGRAAVSAAVYDVRGRLVASVLDGVFPAGSHSFTWDGKDIDGNDVTQGVYFCRFSAGDALEVRKIVALR